jgi:hypothetical protein
LIDQLHVSIVQLHIFGLTSMGKVQIRYLSGKLFDQACRLFLAPNHEAQPV